MTFKLGGLLGQSNDFAILTFKLALLRHQQNHEQPFGLFAGSSRYSPSMASSPTCLSHRPFRPTDEAILNAAEAVDRRYRELAELAVEFPVATLSNESMVPIPEISTGGFVNLPGRFSGSCAARSMLAIRGNCKHPDEQIQTGEAALGWNWTGGIGSRLFCSSWAGGSQVLRVPASVS